MPKIHRSKEIPYHATGFVEVWGFPVHADLKDGDKLHVWYLIDEDNPIETPFRLAYVETGEEYEGHYMFTVVYRDGYVAHVISLGVEDE